MSKFVGKRRSTEASVVLTGVDIAVQRLDEKGDAVGSEVQLGRLVVNKEGESVGLELPGDDQAQGAPGFKLLVRERGRESRTTVTELRYDGAVVDPEDPTPDVEPPSRPGDILVEDITERGFVIEWGASTDNVAVAGYEIVVNGMTVAVVSGDGPFRFMVGGLPVRTEGTDLVQVIANDTSGNVSLPSETSVLRPRSEPDPEEPGDEDPWPELGDVGFLGDPSTLTPMRSGAIRTEGTVIEGRRIDCSDGELGFRAKNIVLRNCIIDCGIWGVYAYNELAEGLIIEDCTFIGGYQAAIGLEQVDGWTVRRCDFYGGRDAIKPGGRGVIEDCTMHDPATGGDAHNDCIQFSDCDGVTVRRNLLMGADTSCIAMFERQVTVRNVTIEDNWLGGAGYLIYAAGETGHNIVIRNNTMGRYGYAHPVTSWDQKPGHVFEGNVYEDGSPVPTPQG